MCGRYRRTTQEEELARLYHIPIPKQTDLPISYHIVYLENDGRLEHAQHIAGHESPFTLGIPQSRQQNRAQGQLYSMLTQQASLLSYFDCFLGLIVPACAGLTLAAAIKNFKPPGKPSTPIN
jgi:hypothetical protein